MSSSQVYRKVRIVCISDTHNAAPGEGYTLPKGDILIHAGDLTNQGSFAELKKAVDWIERADFALKIVVAGAGPADVYCPSTSLELANVTHQQATTTCR